MQRYGYAVFDPRPGADNEKIFEFECPVYGIEVTVPVLAARCTGNIDPQHTEGNADLAAIEVAVSMELPPEGSTLVTVRADLDSVGAMAVLSLRATGADLSPAMERIGLIAQNDKFARGNWPGFRSLPTADELFDDSASSESDSRIAPIAAAVADFKVPIRDRVWAMKFWLLYGEEPVGYRDRWVAERKDISQALKDGTIAARRYRGIARVISSHRAALEIGYCLSPVVVALNPEFRFQGGEPHPKYTICQYRPGYIDLKKVASELNKFEVGWGGSPTIVGSPQGVGSRLNIEKVLEVVISVVAPEGDDGCSAEISCNGCRVGWVQNYCPEHIGETRWTTS